MSWFVLCVPLSWSMFFLSFINTSSWLIILGQTWVFKILQACSIHCCLPNSWLLFILYTFCYFEFRNGIFIVFLFFLIEQNSEWLCRFHGVFVEIFQLISAWVVVGFTVERSFAIWYPIMLRTSRRHRSKIVVLSCSVVFTLFSLSKLFLVGKMNISVYPAFHNIDN